MNQLKLFYKNHSKVMLGVVALMVLQSFGTLLVPHFVANIIDYGILEKNRQAILIYGGWMLLAALFTGVISILSSYYSAHLAGKFGHFLREKLFRKTQELSVTDVEEFGTPTLLARTTSDINNIQQILMMTLQMILPAPLIVLASIILTGTVSVKMIWIPIGAIILFSAIALLVIRRAVPLAEVMQKNVDKMMRILREMYTGVKVIRAFDKSNDEKKRTDDAFTDYSKVMIRVNKLFAVLNPTVNLVMGLSMTAILSFGGWLSGAGQLPVGSITAIIEYTVLSLWFMTMAAMVIVMIPKALTSLNRIEEVLNTENEITDGTELFSEQPTSLVASFNHVDFAYDGAEEPVLKDIHFDIHRGQITAIVGGTGSGKSTIAKALLRLKDAAQGSVDLLGKDVRTVTQTELRNRISYVPQKALLFSGTIMDNFLFGNPDATMEQIEITAEVAQAKDFIEGFPQKYQSTVAQKGSNFSGGQKQRLSIARALIKPADLYFFDDSFSALDYQTDAKLRKALKTYLKDTAVVIVAQRISTIKDADQIIVLDEGKIVGKGTHQQLLKTCNTYQEFAVSQGMEGRTLD
ncbi:ABC transporter ATP-binding protein [Enterococcus larvae]|uniref:ABC transporter ATP-binding protein n=1 Tax=Enterococcus larvae TaxID=2794352 RepID=UPI003F3A436C